MAAFDAGGRLREARPFNWTLPHWVQDAFVRDDMAAECEKAQDWPFLRTGKPPRVGQRLYVNLHYWHDGSHLSIYTGIARMVGHVTEVLPEPEVGLYAVYAGETPSRSKADLRKERRSLPDLPRAMAGKPGSRTAALHEYGAVHGQRARAKLRLNPDDEDYLGAQLGGEWDAVFILNDQKQMSWVLCSMAHAGPTTLPLEQAYPPGRNASKCMFMGPDGEVQEQYSAPPVNIHECAACGAVAGSKRTASGETVALKQCAACRRVFYCSANCQRSHWPAHKEACKQHRRG